MTPARPWRFGRATRLTTSRQASVRLTAQRASTWCAIAPTGSRTPRTPLLAACRISIPGNERTMTAQTLTLVDALQRRVRNAPSEPLFSYLEGDGEVGAELAAADLDRAARAVAASLSDVAPGQRALLLYPPGPDFAAAFLGCLYARIIAVPFPLANPHRLKRQLATVARDCTAALILTDDASAEAIARALDGAPTPAIRTTGRRPTADGDAWDGASPTMDDPAFIQYTSGTTGASKGVLVRHASLTANTAAIKAAFRLTPADVAVTWLPHHHDMGLIGILATTIMAGKRVVLLSPLDMLRRPIRWLRAMTRFGATITGSP